MTRRMDVGRSRFRRRQSGFERLSSVPITGCLPGCWLGGIGNPRFGDESSFALFDLEINSTFFSASRPSADAIVNSSPEISVLSI